MENPERRFRLRKGEKVVGFSKKIGNSRFYSKDNYGWNGNEIEYTQRDLFTGLFDLNRRAIYSKDILEIKNNPNHTFGLIVYDEVLSTFQLITINGEEIISAVPRSFLHEHRFVWKSYLFIQKSM